MTKLERVLEMDLAINHLSEEIINDEAGAISRSSAIALKKLKDARDMIIQSKTGFSDNVLATLIRAIKIARSQKAKVILRALYQKIF